MPIASTVNTTQVEAVGPASAYPSAAPMNGAEQGDATTTASAPDSTAVSSGFFALHVASGEEGDQGTGKQPERHQDTGAECEAVVAHRCVVFAMRSEAEYLEREHRKHARHQIEKHAANKRKKDCRTE